MDVPPVEPALVEPALDVDVEVDAAPPPQPVKAITRPPMIPGSICRSILAYIQTLNIRRWNRFIPGRRPEKKAVAVARPTAANFLYQASDAQNASLICDLVRNVGCLRAQPTASITRPES
ncbi:MAG: hypothetical protein KGL92_01320 [Gammaproteobacteria bacterium]|nr:hypothetical protein [Gammaproteobacteria bacterium]